LPKRRNLIETWARQKTEKEMPPMKPDRRRLCLRSWVALLAVVSSGAGCREKPAEEKPVVQPVKMLTIAPSNARAVREYPGTVSAAQRADMAFEVPGRIVEFPVNEGQKVAEGAVLARLDARDYQARLDSAKAVLDKAKADYERSRNLYREDPGAIALTTLDSDRRGVQVAEAQYREAHKALEDAVLRAPFAGVVGRKLVKDFANVQAKEPVLILQDTSHLEIVVSVPERDFVSGHPSQSLREATRDLQPRVQIPSLPSHTFAARFKEVAATADPTTRTFAATLVFDNPEDLTILPGMTAKVVVRAANGTGAGISIPVNATRADAQGKAYVWVVAPDSMTVKRRAVELGPITRDAVEVKSGLAAGDTIAVSGIDELREGMTVRRFEK
jgi:RND family efflux transporter MFP subunit